MSALPKCPPKEPASNAPDSVLTTSQLLVPLLTLLGNAEVKQRIGSIAQDHLVQTLRGGPAVEAVPAEPVLAESAMPSDAQTPAPEEAPVEAEPDLLRSELAAELNLLQQVRATPWLAGEWLQASESEGQSLVRLIAQASQWDSVEQLARWLCERCRDEKRPASAGELTLLEGCVQLHNRRWHNRQARLEHVEPGTAYDFNRHTRGTDRGETITAQWLPGVRNAAGELVLKPIVATH
jgi:hypothetical protein